MYSCIVVLKVRFTCIPVLVFLYSGTQSKSTQSKADVYSCIVVLKVRFTCIPV